MQAEIDAERRTRERFELLARELIECARPLWHWGDGFGGYVIHTLAKIAESEGLAWGVPPPTLRRKIAKAVKKSVLLQVVARDGFECRYCKSSIDPGNVTIDHIIPLVAGGDSSFGNLCVCCKTCNSRKRDKPLAEFQRLIS